MERMDKSRSLRLLVQRITQNTVVSSPEDRTVVSDPIAYSPYKKGGRHGKRNSRARKAH